PLLAATRADVRRFLAERGLDFAIDRTNADLRHARNRVRRLLVPLLRAEFNPRLGPALAALAERLRDEDDFLAAAAAERARELVVGDHLRAAVAEEPPALARRIVRSWLERGARRGVGAVHVARVLGLAAGHERGDRVRLLAGGTRKLQDVLVDGKVPRETRALLPVLAAGPEILWVPGLARGACAPVGPATTRVVEAIFERAPQKRARG